jgi:hypothetical protein
MKSDPTPSTTPTPRIKTSHFWQQEMPLVTVLRALSSQENNDGDEGNAMAAAGDLLSALYDITEAAPELNMSNYDHDQVSQLNAAMVEAFSLLRAATKGKEDANGK